MYSEASIYITGTARASQSSYVIKRYENLLVVFVIDTATNTILDVDCRVSLEITKKFIKHIFINKNMLDKETIVKAINEKYFGESSKAFIVCYKNALQSYIKIKN